MIHVYDDGKLFRVVKLDKSGNVIHFKRQGEEAVFEYLDSNVANCIIILDAPFTFYKSYGDYRWPRVILGSPTGIYLSDKYPSLLKTKYSLSSWTLEQYTKACENQTFYKSIKPNLTSDSPYNSSEDDSKTSLIEEKFFYAGHCARWFFALSFKQLREQIHTQIERVSECKGYLRLSVGNRDQTTVHHLLAHVDRHRTLVRMSGNWNKIFTYILLI